MNFNYYILLYINLYIINLIPVNNRQYFDDFLFFFTWVGRVRGSSKFKKLGSGAHGEESE